MKNIFKYFVLAIVVILGGIAVFLPEAPVSPLTPEEIKFGQRPHVSSWDNSPDFVRYYLRETLNDPSSLKDLKCGSMKAAKNTQGIEGYFVTCVYSAKNNFGAYTKQSIRLVMNVKSNQVTRLKD